MNKVVLIGNLARDPEITTTNSGVSVCRFSIAVQRRFSSADGGNTADFFNIVVWRGLAENCHKFLKVQSVQSVEEYKILLTKQVMEQNVIQQKLLLMTLSF